MIVTRMMTTNHQTTGNNNITAATADFDNNRNEGRSGYTGQRRSTGGNEEGEHRGWQDSGNNWQGNNRSSGENTYDSRQDYNNMYGRNERRGYEPDEGYNAGGNQFLQQELPGPRLECRNWGDGDRGRNEGHDYDNRGNRDRNDRDWWDKTSDEVSSWFGDDDAKRRRRMDRISEGSHYGKGPKNYKRSDEKIKEDINERLSDDDQLDASNIEVEVNAAEVTLSGTVDSRYAKHRAEDIAESGFRRYSCSE